MNNIKKAPICFTSEEEAKKFVFECEKDFQARLNKTADDISNTKNLKIITLSGPTCSGKTTAANKIISSLGDHQKRVHVISIDDFYYDKEILHRMAEKKDNNEIDYDSAETIDIAALADFISQISRGGEMLCPIFDFHSGKRIDQRKIFCGKEDIFIFEGIQAVYPEVTDLLKNYGYCSVYIAPRSSVQVGEVLFEPNELRLLRRLVRDKNFRSTPAEFTFKIWPSVRNNEDKNIFPYVESCMFHIDSSFAYEIGILKPYLIRALAQVGEGSAYRGEANAILEMIADIGRLPVEYLADDSLYREFV